MAEGRVLWLADASDDILAALDHFFEANHATSKERALAKPRQTAEKDLAKAFRLQGKDFVGRFAALKSLFPIQEAVRNEDWQPLFDAALLATLQAFIKPVDELTQRSLEIGGKAVVADLGLDLAFDLANPRAVGYLQNRGADRVAKINDTTRSYLRTVITEGVEKGWSYDRTAKAITDRYGEFAVGRPQQHIDSRAHLIVLTESGDAYEEANLIVGQDLADAGLEMQKSWLAINDERTDPGICGANAAQGWIPLAQPFQSGHDRPLGHPACRCTMLIRRKPAKGD